MKRSALFLLLAFISVRPVAANGGKALPKPMEDRFENLMLLTATPSDFRLFFPAQVTAGSYELAQWNNLLDQYCQEWKQKKASLPDQQLLKALFYDVHRRFLKHYTPYTGLTALLEQGEYNCLSATALYAQLLNRLEYPYELIESNQHIVLLVKPGQQQLLLESTDPTAGFVTEPAQIEERLQKMQQKETSSAYFDLGVRVFRTITLRELAGLQYFNLAAWHFNQGHYQQATAALQKGEILYPSSRFTELKKLIATR